MNKKNIKIIICLFIILGIFAISKNVYAETEVLTADRVITVEDIERKDDNHAVILTTEEIKKDIIKQDSYCKNFDGTGKLKDLYISDNNIAKATIEKEGLRIIGKKAGQTELKITLSFYKTIRLAGAFEQPQYTFKTIKYKVIVKDPLKEIDDKIKEGEKTQNDMTSNLDNAYNHIPDANAKASEIKLFLMSDHLNNNQKNMKTVDKKTLESWRTTVQAEYEKNPEIYKQTYYPIEESITKLINGDDPTSMLDIACEEYQKNIAATQNTIDNYKKQRLEILKSIGEARNVDYKFTDVLTDTENYVPEDSDSGNQKVEEKASVILTIITNVGIILSVLMSAIIGVKYMLASVEERVEYKQEMIPYLVGAVLVFGISTIVKILQDVGIHINNVT